MSAMTFKHLKLRNVDGVAVVDFIDSGLMYETALIQEIGKELESLPTDHGHTKILLDFTHVQYMSSPMLGQLRHVPHQFNQKGFKKTHQNSPSARLSSHTSPQTSYETTRDPISISSLH